MTHRERHMAWLEGKRSDRVPDWEFRAWQQTIDRWRGEGLPESYGGRNEAITAYFHTDDSEYGPSPSLAVEEFPAFEPRVLEVRGDTQIIVDGDGVLCEMLRPELGASIPKYLRFPIETRKDWERFRDERLRLSDPRRVPAELEDLCRASKAADYPVVMWAGSLYGKLRNWMGMENISLALMEDPPWVEEMMEHMTILKLEMFSKVAGKCVVDRVDWWEDMCYRAGPLMSPAHFAKLMVPRYRRVTEFLRQECGCRFNMVDCDGNIHHLASLWLEAGVNVMFPLEAMHTNACRLSEEFGARMPLRGYFDKRALIAGPKAIDAEFERLRPLLRTGSFVPHTDHLVPPDVSWKDYVYYRRKKCGFLGKEYRES